MLKQIVMVKNLLFVSGIVYRFANDRNRVYITLYRLLSFESWKLIKLVRMKLLVNLK